MTSLSLSASNGIQQDQVTTKELAEQLGTRSNVITENAKKCLPDKKIENGKATYWTKEEVTILLEFMKTNNNRTDLDLSHRLIGTSTDLSPALKIKQAMEMMQSAYEEELAIIKARALEAERVVSQIADGKGCYTMNQAAKALKLPYGNIKLFELLRSMNILNHDNTPKQEQVNNGNFKVIVKYVNEKVGSKPVTLVTGKGIVYLSKRMDTQIDHTVLPDA